MMRAIIIGCCVSVLVCGCSNKHSKNSDYPPNENPGGSIEEFVDNPSPLNVENEDMYNNISIKLDKELYNSQDVVECTITNANKGKGFYYYYIPFVEYFNGEEWIRLSYYPSETEYEEQWYYCAVEGSDNLEYSTNITLDMKYIKEQLIDGKYRLLVFVGPNEYKAEFEIKEENI